MDWINLHTSFLDSPSFLGAEPVDRATWLCLLRYCVGQENGGMIVSARAWGDRRWQQLVRVTLKEVTRDTDLWQWRGDDLSVAAYPSEKEGRIKAMRALGGATSEAKTQAAKANGTKGGRPTKNQTIIPTENPTKTQRDGFSITHGKPIEGEGEGERKGKGNNIDSSAGETDDQDFLTKSTQADGPNFNASPGIPPRLLDVWREIATDRSSDIANNAYLAAKRLFPGTSPNQLLMTYQCNATAGKLSDPPGNWLDFRTIQRADTQHAKTENATPQALAAKARAWFIEQCGGAEIYVKGEAILAALRRCGGTSMASIAARVLEAGEGVLSAEAFRDMIHGVRSQYDHGWHIQPLPVLSTPLTDAQVMEIIS